VEVDAHPVMRIAALTLLLALFQAQDPAPDKAVGLMLKCMSEGRYVEGRAVAEHITHKWPGTPAAEKARPYTRDSTFLAMSAADMNGPMGNRIDFTIMGDAIPYSDSAQKAWKTEADAIFESLFKTGVLKEYAPYFNLFRAQVASKDWRLNKRDAPAETYFHSFEEDGEVRTDESLARGIADKVGSPDRLALVHVRPAVAEHGRSRSGVAVVGFTRPSSSTVLHAFGHAFAGLADEAASRKVWGGLERQSKVLPPMPTAPNVADTKDPAAVPWAHWLKAREAGDKRASKIGVMEGAALRAMKAWRPVDESLCVMNDGNDFCPVCREVVVLLLYSYVRPIDEGLPYDKPLVAAADANVKLWIRTLKPATHRLTVGWIVEKAQDTDRAGADARGGIGGAFSLSDRLRCADGSPGPRRGEGLDWRMPQGEPLDSDPVPPKGDVSRAALTLDRSRLAPGRYRVTAVVRDLTEWVLRDELNLLADWRTWLVEIK
jgi:hypothetical protein